MIMLSGEKMMNGWEEELIVANSAQWMQLCSESGQSISKFGSDKGCHKS